MTVKVSASNKQILKLFYMAICGSSYKMPVDVKKKIMRGILSNGGKKDIDLSINDSRIDILKKIAMLAGYRLILNSGEFAIYYDSDEYLKRIENIIKSTIKSQIDRTVELAYKQHDVQKTKEHWHLKRRGFKK